MRSPLKVSGVLEAHDEPDQAYQLTLETLRLHTRIAGVYVSTANSASVLRALQETGRLGKIAVVTTDLFPALVPMIRSGEVLATVYQRPKTQGRMAFQSLHQFLVEGSCPPPRHRLPPHIILQSNLDLFLEMQPADLEALAK